MAEDKLIFLNSLKLVFTIILIFNQSTNSSGSDYNSYNREIIFPNAEYPTSIDYRNSPNSVCESLTSSISTRVQCEHNGKTLLNCLNPIHGTIVQISCNPSFEEPSLQKNPIRFCRNGQWSSFIPTCKSISSVQHPKIENSNILSGDRASYQGPCSSLTSSVSTKFTCKRDGKALRDCKNPIDGTTALILCNPLYTEQSLKDDPIRICKNGKWNSAIPECHRDYDRTLSNSFGTANTPSSNNQASFRKSFCPSLTSNISTNVKCQLNGQSLKNCDNPVEDTTVLISCKSFYEEPNLVKNPVRLCKNGKWSSSILQCYSITGGTSPRTPGNFNSYNQRVSRNRGCQPLTSSISTTFTCQIGGTPLQNCENPTEGTTVIISCNSYYEESSLQRNPVRACTNGNWSSSIPKCHPISREIPPTAYANSNQQYEYQTSYNRICPSLKSSISTNVRCQHNGQPLQNCDNPSEGTSVEISCNTFYEEPSLKQNSIRMCRNGNWSSPIPKCYPICGKVTTRDSNSFVGGGYPLHDYPWHVGIYNNAKAYACGGSIINTKNILTAAHCVTDDGKNLKSPEYFVGAGKYYRNYGDQRDTYSQYSKVANIHMPGTYRGATLYYSSDIAILSLSEPFKLSIAVQPVCIELNGESHNTNSNSVGTVTGWGYVKPGGPPSEVLKELKIPYIPRMKCIREVPQDFQQYVTVDKICGGYKNRGVGICNEDGGGGFIFKNSINDRYYVKAIASVGPFKNYNECDMNQYAGYTLVSYHIEFVKTWVASF